MPNDPTVWIVLIVVAAVVIALLGTLAIRSGRRLKITRGSLEIDKSAADSNAQDNDAISVAAGASIKNSKTGDIAGIKATDAGAVGGAIDVARGAHIENADVGDIAGVKQSGSPDKS